MAVHAYYPMNIDVVMGDVYQVTESIDCPISVYCVVVYQYGLTSLVRPFQRKYKLINFSFKIINGN